MRKSRGLKCQNSLPEFDTSKPEVPEGETFSNRVRLYAQKNESTLFRCIRQVSAIFTVPKTPDVLHLILVTHFVNHKKWGIYLC